VVILVIIGILLGLIFGPLLCAYVLKTVEIDTMIFPLTINATSYLYSILLAMVFSAIVMLFMHFKIRKIDMVEAMKAVE
jgi:putative ABC transport system permease protein